jgi:hypothetical protein
MTKDQFYDYCMEHAHRIFIRAKVGEKWGSYSLQQLSNASRERQIDQWFRENRMPVMVKN